MQSKRPAEKPMPAWWGRPRNFSERKHERKISWLELFYDLVYVAAIAQLTHHLAAHPSWKGAAYTFLLFCLVFWAWVNGSQYYDLHGNDSIRTRLLTFWQMLAAAATAITIGDAFEGHHQGLAVSFAIVQALITYLWWSVGLYDRSHRVFNKFYTLNYSLAFALLVASVFVSAAVATKLWIVVLLLNLTPSLTGARTIVRVLKERGQVFTASATIVERFGLFTIIVLAESILGTVTGMAEIHDKTPVVWIAFILAILISFLLWSLYFDMTSEQETKKGYSYLQWLVFLHYPLLAAFGIIGACLKVMLGDKGHLRAEVQWMFCVSLATILVLIVALTKIMKEDEEDRAFIRPVSRLLLVMAVLLLFIPLFAPLQTTLSLLSITAVLLFVPVFIGIRSWIRFRFFGKK